MKNIAFFLFFLLIVFGIYPQPTFDDSNFKYGIIRGKILDAKTGEAIVGAMVVIDGTTQGTTTDLDGNFQLKVPANKKISLKIQYIGYVNKTIDGLQVDANDEKEFSVSLEESKANQLDEVEIVTSVIKENNFALILQQKNNASVSDGVSAETIKRTPDRNTSDVIKRVSGATIQENKFAIIRGMNDRYNAAYINGAPLPSSESDRKAFSFDIFPSNALDNLVILKTARPDYPAEFGGGIIEITTKSIPDKNFISISTSAGYNTFITNQKQVAYKGSKTDFLGFDNGKRALSKDIPSYEEFPVNIHERAEMAKKIHTGDWSVYTRNNADPNTSFQFSGGMNIKRKGEDFFGFYAALNHNRSLSLIKTHRNVIFAGSPNNPEDPLIFDRLLYDKNYQTNVNSSMLFNAGLKLNKFNQFKFLNIASLNSEDRTIFRQGTLNPVDQNPYLLKAYALWFTQNRIISNQLIGEHVLGNKNDFKILWNLNRSAVNRKIPNLRRHSYTRNKFLNMPEDPSESPNPLDTVYKANLGEQGSNSPDYSGVSMWADLKEVINSAKLDFSKSFKINDKFQMELKTGGLIQRRNREFDFRTFIYSKYQIIGGNYVFNENIAYQNTDQIFIPENMGIITPSTPSSPNVGGFILSETTDPQSPYWANSNLNAGFLMGDFRYSKIRLVTGVRYENYYQYIKYRDNNFRINKKFNELDTVWNNFLPSVNLIYSLNDKTNIRASWSKTLNRPEFRELAPFIFYDFNTNYSLSGDPKLKYSLIDNFDLRYEIFPAGGQLFSFSLFYKDIVNPIEIYQSLNKGNLYYGNAPSAYARGLELEYRYNIGNLFKDDSTIFSKIINNLTLSGNLAFIESKVRNINYTYERPLQGQSPYVLNFGLNYFDAQSTWGVSIMYNRVGPRLAFVGNNLFQEIWEGSRDIIDLQLSKSFLNKKLEVKFNVRDLLAENQSLIYYANFSNYKFNNRSTLFNKKASVHERFWIQNWGTVYSLSLSWRF
ncbi:MAG: TonB-dependent receptor [Bacteroidia bacterium]|nr:TonB-dependent receptor [Bacteroidia bacterium]